MDNSSQKLSSNAAQKIMIVLLKAARAQIDICASSKSAPRDRARAMRRLERAIAAVSEKNTDGR